MITIIISDKVVRFPKQNFKLRNTLCHTKDKRNKKTKLNRQWFIISIINKKIINYIITILINRAIHSIHIVNVHYVVLPVVFLIDQVTKMKTNRSALHKEVASLIT